MRKVLLVLFSLILTLNIILPAQANKSFEVRETKAYTLEEESYLMDFSKVSDIKEYADKEEWQVSSLSSTEIVNGKLVCKSNRSFSIRTSYSLGDDYGLYKGSFSFDASIKGGDISIGSRLFSNTTVKESQGLWFTISKNNIVIEDSRVKLKETYSHKLDLSGEKAYALEDDEGKVSLMIGGQTILVVEIGKDTYTIKDGSGNEVKTHANENCPLAGFIRMDVSKLEGTLDKISYNYNKITQNLKYEDNRTMNYSNWVATDDLERVTLTSKEARSSQKEKYVGLFYFINHIHSSGGEIRDHTKIYLEQGLDALKKFLPTSPGGHWAEPYLGYYLSTEAWIYRKHAAMLEAAGVDFIFLDLSNASTFPESHTVLFDTWLQIRKEGGNTPQIVPMCGDMPATLVIDMYTINETIFSVPEYDELLFKWEGKPLILGNNDKPDGEVWSVSGTTPQTKDDFYQVINQNKRVKEFYESGAFDEAMSKLTVRKSWAWQTKRYNDDNKTFAGYWDWLDFYPQSVGRSFEGVIEQITVTMGTHAHTNKGRSFLGVDDYGTGLEDFDFTLGKAQYGLCFEQQFKHAMTLDPKVMMITGWNEWYAGVIKRDNPNLITGHTSTPGYYLVDQFNPEFSRDGEPMKIRDGVGFGDNYYYQMVSYIREFKGMEDPDIGSGQKNIDISKGLDEWTSVGPRFNDYLNDTVFRNFISWGGVYKYINNTGRNDLDYAKISQDNENIYFLITTANDIVTVDETNWMNLFIDIDMDFSTGWEGYDFVINRSRDGSKVSVEKFVNNSWEFEKLGEAEYFLGDKSLSIKIPKSLLNVDEAIASFDFKWTDNSTDSGNVMEFMDLGDSAPDSRFNYRFYGTAFTRTKSKTSFQGLTTTHYIIAGSVIAIIIIVAAVIVTMPKKKKEE